MADYAAAKRLPEEFLRGLGLDDDSYADAPAVRVPYLDEAGVEVAIRFRVELNKREVADRRFRWRTGDKCRLYGLSRLGDARLAGQVVLVEGESDAQTLWHHGFHALGIPGASNWQEGWASAVDGIPAIFVVIEPDVGGAGVLKWLSRSGIRHRVRLITLDGAKDPSELYISDPPAFPERWRAAIESSVPYAEPTPQSGPTSVAELVSGAFKGMPEKPTPDDRVAALRRLASAIEGRDELERTSARQQAVHRLASSGVTVKEAEALVRAALPVMKDSAASQSLQGSALDLSDPTPWPDSVDGACLADEMTALLLHYIVLPDESAWAVVLWILFTYLLDVAQVAPRLLLSSPVRECGKTRLMTLIWTLARRALPGSSVTPAALFRVIEAHAPSLLLDEIDNMRLNEKPELLAVMNSGHTRGTAKVLRPVGEDHEIRGFSTWCALAMAGIRTGSLPDTVVSRAITIPLIRKLKGVRVPRQRESKLYAELESLRRKLVRWSADHGQEIGDAEPVLPVELDGRAADNWSVLISIANALGGEWPGRARLAAAVLERSVSGSDGAGETLLADLHDLFEERAVERLSSEEIVAALAKLEGRPWAEWGRQRKPLSKNQLAKLLKEFDIEPRTIRLDGDTRLKGYLRECFEDAWERYLSSSPISQPLPRDKAVSMRVDGDFQAVTDGMGVTGEEVSEGSSIAARHGVTDQTGVEGGERALDPCRHCNGTGFWVRRGGGEPVCERCHPAPAESLVGRWIGPLPEPNGDA